MYVKTTNITSKREAVCWCLTNGQPPCPLALVALGTLFLKQSSFSVATLALLIQLTQYSYQARQPTLVKSSSYAYVAERQLKWGIPDRILSTSSMDSCSSLTLCKLVFPVQATDLTDLKVFTILLISQLEHTYCHCYCSNLDQFCIAKQ